MKSCPTRNRSRLAIYVAMLKAAKRSPVQTHIMYAANMSWGQMRRYLPTLIDAGLLEEANGGYPLSAKGEAFLATIAALRGALEEVKLLVPDRVDTA